MLEFAVAAIWGCAVVIQRHECFDPLKATVNTWAPALRTLSAMEDSRVRESVPCGASQAMALLAGGLTRDLLASFPQLIFEYMTIVETADQMQM